MNFFEWLFLILLVSVVFVGCLIIVIFLLTCDPDSDPY